jgi:hypothetical protein
MQPRFIEGVLRYAIKRVWIPILQGIKTEYQFSSHSKIKDILSKICTVSNQIANDCPDSHTIGEFRLSGIWRDDNNWEECKVTLCAQRGEAARSALKATLVCVDQSVALKNLYTRTWKNVPTKNGGQLSVRPPAHGRKQFAGFWLVEKLIFPNILPIMASEQQTTVGTHIRKFSELSKEAHGNRDVIRIKNE